MTYFVFNYCDEFKRERITFVYIFYYIIKNFLSKMVNDEF